MFKKIIIIVSVCLCLWANGYAQRETLDKIVAVIGNRVVLESELVQTLTEMKRQDAMLDDSYKCQLLQNLIGQYILCEQAERDSVEVSEEEVEANLDNRLRYFTQVYGSAERMEEVTGKTMGQIKEDYRKLFKDKMLAERMQGQLMSGVKITPNEVKEYFNNIPKDSLPTYPSMIELGQLVLKPVASKEAEDYVKQELQNMRQEIVEGKSSFETMAGIYSEDPGSKDNGGGLGVMKREELDPAFAAAAFKLQNGEISDVVKSSFGFHIIQMIQRKGDKASLRHILLRPKVLQTEVDKCMTQLDSVRNLVTTGKMSFTEAVGKFSKDERTKLTGGMFTSGQSNSSFLAQEELDPDLILQVADLKSGQFSKSYEFTDPQTGDRACRFLFAKSIIEPHEANLTLDYNKIMQVALADKQNKFLIDWLLKQSGKFYVRISDDYKNCEELKLWLNN